MCAVSCRVARQWVPVLVASVVLHVADAGRVTNISGLPALAEALAAGCSCWCGIEHHGCQWRY
jgi:hypothetical protein